MGGAQAGLVVRLADHSFADYVRGSDYGFRVQAYATAVPGQPVADWPRRAVPPYRKCYGIDPDEFRACLDSPDAAVFMAWLNGRAVGHLVVTTHWNGLAQVDELAVDASARRKGVARALLEVAGFWAHKKFLPGIVLETQNNNLDACRLYESCGFVLGGSDCLRYKGIDPQTEEVALFWYRLF
ncbi:GNAT family N-acetyltransferase [Pseudomonas sp. HR96]|uniref:GNAT family N-acetyltransferase n=1 Tax=Pseudomonas sp. HR96 TaxID=1027966 RepID=UPI002A75DBC4|nr:GNAT family N-acetyltransferase [Pseudomonas sp. HR96]WPP02190.1 GNAT family N-acetyltransferase [Pseudomonas sp. HR96]